MDHDQQLARWESRDAHNMPVCFLHLTDLRNGDDPQKVLPVWEHDIFKVGRDPGTNTFAIRDDENNMVSRNHCEIYIVVYEPGVNHVYVRDRKSCNGTYVNKALIGMGPAISSGHLLEDGDVISIKPHWTFLFRQERPPPRFELTSLQFEECQLFAQKYSLTQRCLGHGSEAKVYLALETLTRKQVVCKLVDLTLVKGVNSHDVTRRKLQEVDTLRQLQHPNILSYIDAFSSPYTLYTFTELASGGDLLSFINRHGCVTEFDARVIIRQVVRGLRYLHDKGIAHRDLKPENILLACSPGIAYHRVMLSDFGTCAMLRRSRMLTEVGTVNYQAPEIFRGAERQTLAVDIWSLGVVSLTLLATGSAADINHLNHMDQKTLKNALTKIFPHFAMQASSDGKNFIWHCLRTKPSERMTALAAECHDWLCTPEEHLEFFRKLDRRMLAEWPSRNDLKPMPWELPRLRYSPIETEKSDERIECTPDPDDRGTIRNPSPSRNILTESRHFPSHNGNTAPRDNQLGAQRSSTHDTFKKPQAPVYTNTGALRTYGKKQSRPPWKGYMKQQRSPLERISSNKRKRSSKTANIPDSTFLPLNTLERHLQGEMTKSQREVILAELRKKKSKFLVDHPLKLQKAVA